MGEMGMYDDELSAHLYDLQYNSASEDVPFYLEQAGRAPGAILELACGTGRLLVPILNEGCAIEGLDSSSAMLARLEMKLSEYNLTTTLYQQDMAEFRITKKFSRIFIPVCSFLLLSSQEEQIRCLERSREHLEPGGQVVMDFLINSFDTSLNHGKARRFSREIKTDDGFIHVFRIVSVDPVQQREFNTYYYEFYSPEGVFEKMLVKKLDFRWAAADEFRLMARTAGFSKVRLEGGYRGEPLKAESKHLIAYLEN